MVPVTQYTNSDAIRAAVGVTDNELSDAMMTDSSYDLQIEADLDSWVDHESIATSANAASAAVAAAETSLVTNQTALTAAETSLALASAGAATATSALDAAQAAYDADPSPANYTALTDAISANAVAQAQLATADSNLLVAQTNLATATTTLADAKATQKTAQKRANLLSLYAMWAGGVLAAATILALPRKQTNGKDAFERFAPESIRDAQRHAAEQREKYRGLLEGEQLDLISLRPSFAQLSSPAYDPITNDGFDA